MLQVTGDSKTNLLRIDEIETDNDDRHVHSPPEALSFEVYIFLVWNPNFHFGIHQALATMLFFFFRFFFQKILYLLTFTIVKLFPSLFSFL